MYQSSPATPVEVVLACCRKLASAHQVSAGTQLPKVLQQGSLASLGRIEMAALQCLDRNVQDISRIYFLQHVHMCHAQQHAP